VIKLVSDHQKDRLEKYYGQLINILNIYYFVYYVKKVYILKKQS